MQLGSGTIGDDALIGMGSRVGDRVVVERGACIGAGALGRAGHRRPGGMDLGGTPGARVSRSQGRASAQMFARARDIYVEY